MINNAKEKNKIFLWNMLGSISTAAISVVLLMVVTRYLSKFDSDIYAFAYSFANMMVVVALFQVRNFQATDISEKYTFTQYFTARLITCLVMIVISIIYIALSNYNFYKSYIIFLVCIYRMTDAFSDLYQGMFQQHERLDIAGKSLTFRNSIIFLIYTSSLLIFENLVLSLQLVCVVSILFIVFYDFRKAIPFKKIETTKILKFTNIKNSFSLLKESFPLFLNGFLIIYIYTQPKYSIETMTLLHKIPLGSQTIFNILFMPAFVMNLMMLFFRPHITMMAIAILSGKYDEFKTIQLNLFKYLALASVIILIGSGLVGIPFLSILYAIKLNNYWVTFMLIMMGGAIGSFATAIDNILTAMRKQKYLIIPYSGSFVFSFFITNILVEKYQLLGASISFILVMSLWLFLSILIYIVIMKNFKKRKGRVH